MTAKQVKTRAVEKTDYRVYFKKGKEFYQTMFQAEKAENWNAVGLNGVHCVISLIDAILVNLGKDSSDDIDHLGNRRVRTVGELVQTQFRIGFLRLEHGLIELLALFKVHLVIRLLHHPGFDLLRRSHAKILSRGSPNIKR